ncbi:MAG: aspartate--tRNA ligase [Candidatus Omnitrophica bacterium]|jgi:aspartyl-tRNA synthetase|nr:aspartate--tRNA ligase [Candidatus Omnitrophota bacterium]
MIRTHTCGQLTIKDIGKEVKLAGWVSKIRDHGNILFIDLRDRYGITQIVIDDSDEIQNIGVKPESVISIEGTVVQRPDSTINSKLLTGEIEVKLEKINILNDSHQPLPFEIEDAGSVNENVRLKYRYLDLRRNEIKENIIFRSKFIQSIREFLGKENFLEIETPMLTKSTPEGARDFLVPSRLESGKFYALPQSPQLFKQILMISGFDKYFQVARCFRDEDLRADRQPEFTQIDMEMSFVEQNDIINISEAVVKYAIEKTLDINIETPFPKIKYSEAMEKYGTDKPDISFGFILQNITDYLKKSGLDFIDKIIEKNGIIKAIKIEDGDKISLKDIDNINQFIKEKGGNGIGWIRFKDNDYQSPIKKFLKQDIIENIKTNLNIKSGALILFLGGNPEWVNEILGFIRIQISDKLKIKNPDNKFYFLWIVDFPLFEFSKEENKIVSRHHPFTSPEHESFKNHDNPLNITAQAYDLVLNGTEIGGGSIRIHKKSMQEKIFEILGIKKEDYQEKFGFLLDALSFGAPPHGGIAFGLDRLIMLLKKQDSIREIIAFPKTQKGTCLLSGAPDYVESKQLKDLKIKIDLPEK